MLYEVVDNNEYDENSFNKSMTHIEVTAHRASGWRMAIKISISAVHHERTANGYTVTSGDCERMLSFPDESLRYNKKKIDALVDSQLANKASETWQAINKVCKDKNLKLKHCALDEFKHLTMGEKL